MNLTGYIDVGGLVSPYPLNGAETGRASDNGVLFTSQALIMLHSSQKYNECVPLLWALNECVDSEGNLHRSNDDTTPDAPDDHYGILAAAIVLGIRIPIRLNSYKLWHPSLIYLQSLMRGTIWHYLLAPLVAIIYLFSNTNEPELETSNRLLTWTVVQALKKRGGPLVRMATSKWESRTLKLYMRWANLFGIYFGPHHPFTLWNE